MYLDQMYNNNNNHNAIYKRYHDDDDPAFVWEYHVSGMVRVC